MTCREELASLPVNERIAIVIDRAGLDQEGFAMRLEAPRETVNRWVRGHSRPGMVYRRKLAGIATEICGEPISPDMFRERASSHSVEEAAAQLVQSARALSEATQTLVGLLAEQRDVVEKLNRLVSALERTEAAPEGHAG